MDTSGGGMMSQILTALHALRDKIEAAGIPASLDPRDLDAPGALLELTAIGRDNTVCGDTAAQATVYLIAPDHGAATAVETLLEMYEAISHLSTGASTISLALPETAPLPCLRLEPIELIGD